MERAEASMMESLLQQSSSPYMVCPVCLKAPAHLMTEGCQNFVTCICGLKFPLPSHMSLGDFESALVTCADVHHMSCSAVPQHQVRTTGSTIQFASSCESCQTLSIIFEHPQV